MLGFIKKFLKRIYGGMNKKIEKLVNDIWSVDKWGDEEVNSVKDLLREFTISCIPKNNIRVYDTYSEGLSAGFDNCSYGIKNNIKKKLNAKEESE